MTVTLKSNTGLFSIARKVLIFAMVAVGHLVDGILGDGHMFRIQSSFFIFANELMSIIENEGNWVHQLRLSYNLAERTVTTH